MAFPAAYRSLKVPVERLTERAGLPMTAPVLDLFVELMLSSSKDHSIQ
jgi:hypothetical protein